MGRFYQLLACVEILVLFLRFSKMTTLETSLSVRRNSTGVKVIALQLGFILGTTRSAMHH